MNEYLDDDENAKAMRETAKRIGLTNLLLKISHTNNAGQSMELLRQALRLLGEPS